MKLGAVAAARERLEWAQEAYIASREAKTYGEFRKAWIRFLNAHNAVYSKLGKGVRDDPASRSWMDKKSQERKEDQLLQYLHQARNSDEHGIQSVTGTIGGYDIGFASDGSMNVSIVGDKLQFGSGPRPQITEFEEWALVPVVNRGVTYNPPRHHFHIELPEVSPDLVGSLGIEYLAKILSEAEKLVNGPSEGHV